MHDRSEGIKLEPLHSLDVLLVEDVALLAMHAKEILERFGAASVHLACDVKQAFDIVGSQTIDFALLDLNLNGDRSDPVIELLADRGVPFVLTTGYGATAGAPGIIVSKPYSDADLLSAINAAFGADGLKSAASRS